MIDAEKVLSSTESVSNLCRLLKLVIERPGDFAQLTELTIAMKSQGALASLTYAHANSADALQTRSMSLNTLKSTADSLLVGGFSEFDRLRLDALAAIREFNAKSVKGNKRTKSGILALNADIEKELEVARIANFRLLQAVTHSLSSFKNICDANDEGVRIKRTRDSEEVLRKILSMNFPGTPRGEDFSATSNVVDFKK
jgi:hypothetical protein